MQNFHLIKIRNSFENHKIIDVEKHTISELGYSLAGINLSGASIGIAVGSRGISDIAKITRAVVDFVKIKGGHPFIILAMGSHGGATSAGQQDLIRSYGITSESIGAPIDSSMDVVELSDNSCPCRIFMSRAAFESDGVIVINRIKPHTDFHGSYESGLVKMCVIGLGKHAQALEIHKFGVEGLKNLIPVSARKIISTGKILLGVGVIENACDQTFHIEAVPAEKIMKREPQLLDIAKKNMPSLPVDHADILIVDKIGKDISGTGLDPNIIGRLSIRGETEPEKPDIKQIIVSSLTEKSHGNALGIGLADIISKRLFNSIDFKVMYENAFTSSFLQRAKIPVIANSDLEAFSFALRAAGVQNIGQSRVIRIPDTLHLEEVYVSKVIFNEIKTMNTITKISEPAPLFSGNDFCCF
ncbi:MAG: DUF2088 domain-containing protein [Fibrobacter sp.]|nr:DUF2088 domain-containing protein [Fibrobacter sp.]